ncbi:hypothetical protein ITP53_19380 [Nonomuraea sp. K274]|uniref:Tetratricopeptide repeat protein n=1 Tax=Nonomuraea cypriaca TaxID=1187855 RepID=A0A931A9S5_9ACTN|nr:hypothetical protein [Nonomuraea cypriaca]MBF8187858.1 hypothetical protein [Nonomuraea cypriaca]
MGPDLKLALVLGERALYVNGDLQTARRWYDRAYRQAETCGDPIALAMAALGLGGIWLHEHRTCAESERVRARQRHALSLLDPRSPLALRLRVRLSGEQDYRTGGHDTIMPLLAQARRSGGDATALAEALSLAHQCLLGPEHAETRLELATALIGQAGVTGRRSDLLMGLLCRTIDLYLAADPHTERCLEELHGLLTDHDHLAVGYVADSIDVMLTIRAGRFAEAEKRAGECLARGVAAGDLDAPAGYGGQLGAIRWFQGRVAELLPVLSDMVTSPTLSPVDNSYLAGLAVAAATAGDVRLAAGSLARLRGRDLSELPRSSTWLTSMYCVVEAAHLLQDADTAARAYALLSPFAGLSVVAGLGVACFGSVHHSLGMAALAMGDVDRAAGHLRAAVQGNLALGHWPAVALSRCRLGQALALRDGPRDRAALREQALATEEARQLGMVLPAVVGRAVPAHGACRFGRHGRHWQVELGGRLALVDHSVGMTHLATLVANPGREILAADLAGGTWTPDGDGSSDQPVLDDVARDAYRERLGQLEAAIDELESMNDLERAAALRLEREWLVAELGAATGIGGRARPFAGNEERARIAVGKAIRRALSRISAVDRVIGDELRGAVQMGLRCCYRPRRPGG